jgi:threonine/homoserine/homoserine lactone efflux protein
MESHHLVLFALAGIVLNLTPGPDVLLVVRHALRSGARAGFFAGLGVAAGCLVHVSAGALGLSALLAGSSQAFALLKWLGAAYLLFVAWGLLRSALNPRPPSFFADSSVQATVSARSVFLQGFGTNVLNPKVALFFLAFVPQFIPSDAADKPLYFLALGILFTANGLLVSSAYAWGAAWMARRLVLLQSALRALDGVAACMFMAFGIQLALSDAPSSS